MVPMGKSSGLMTSKPLAARTAITALKRAARIPWWLLRCVAVRSGWIGCYVGHREGLGGDGRTGR